MKKIDIIIIASFLFCVSVYAQSPIRRQTSNNTRTQTTAKPTQNSNTSRRSTNSRPATSSNSSQRTTKPRTETSYRNEVLTVNGVSYDMVKVQAGTFTMGSREEGETPMHQVTLTNDYYIGKTEVTQALWKAVMGNNPSNFRGDNLPVECVSWNDCQEFISKLNSMTGQNFRLPTEAEWEFAARGGNKSKGFTYSGSNNLGSVAWYDGNSGCKTHAVATKQPNELGIYDMSGNVWEWCADWYGNYSSSSQTNPIGSNSGAHRVNRGGSWNFDASFCRSSCRGNGVPDYGGYGYGYLGFRLALSQ